MENHQRDFNSLNRERVWEEGSIEELHRLCQESIQRKIEETETQINDSFWSHSYMTSRYQDKYK